MARVALRRGSDVQQLLRRDLLRVDRVHREAALGQRAGLVKHDRVHTVEHFEVVGALDEHAVARGPADPAEEAQRHGDHERAGAGHHEEDQRALDPLAPGPLAEQRRQHCQQQRAHDDEGGIPAGKARDKVLDARLLLGGVLHELQDARHRALGIGALGADLQQAREADAAGDHPVARGDIHRQALAGERGGVHAAAALEHRAVERDLLPRSDQQGLPHRHLLGVELPLLPVAQHAREVGADIHERGDGLAAAPDGDGLKELTDLVKQHDRRGLGVLPRREGAERRDRHQELLVKDLAVCDIAHSAPEHVPADHQVGHREREAPPDSLKRQQRRHQGEQRRREDPAERFLLPSCHGRFISGSPGSRAPPSRCT